MKTLSVKRQATGWEKIFAKDKSYQCLLSKNIKNKNKNSSVNNKKTTQFKNGPKTLKDTSQRKYINSK